MAADLLPILVDGTRDTLYITGLSSFFAALLGIPLGTILVVTRRGHILECPLINRPLGWIVDVGRAIPFVILMIYMFPATRLLVGKAMGAPETAIPPLTLAAAPFVARMVEGVILKINHGVIEAAQSAGATPWQIIWKVLLPESVSGLINAITIAVIAIIGYSTMAGLMGAGGLGAVAVSYGVNRWRFDIMTGTVVLLVILVMGVQFAGDKLTRRFDHGR